ncbi:DsbA family protein [Rarobacter incanus]|uniref:Protein-disulfide isomerase n=1 Tax=Rarobacter incanus TaxID=153494 RepID=A0A542SNS3_9MICO|nr:thioredoxin domain-containing protein [Rarobacter incanus]TQK76286.1 protein-disulfide isomerase [Rarobacter incanus]
MITPTRIEVSAQDLVRQVRRWKTVALILGVIAAFLAVVLAGEMTQGAAKTSGASGQAGDGSDATAAASDDQTAAANLTAATVARAEDGDAMAFGSADAPVTIVEWADYRCPFCAAFANDTFPTLYKEYIETGKVRYEFHDVVFFGEDSRAAAIAGRAAAKQGRFLEFMEVLYAAAPQSGHPDLPTDKLVGFAQKAQMPDLDAFRNDLGSADLGAQVDAATATAQQLGVTAVPYFVVGDQVLSGAQSIDTFRQVIEAQLGQAGQ